MINAIISSSLFYHAPEVQQAEIQITEPKLYYKYTSVTHIMVEREMEMEMCLGVKGKENRRRCSFVWCVECLNVCTPKVPAKAEHKCCICMHVCLLLMFVCACVYVIYMCKGTDIVQVAHLNGLNEHVCWVSGRCRLIIIWGVLLHAHLGLWGGGGWVGPSCVLALTNINY